jgi:MinD-like ATPase involved in chromosome partitioning or flagellar assembly
VRTAEDVKLGFAVQSVCRKYFGLDAEYLGYVNHDDSARQSVSARTPVVEFNASSDASIYLQRIARKLVGAAVPRTDRIASTPTPGVAQGDPA